jgi:hypothetical protein
MDVYSQLLTYFNNKWGYKFVNTCGNKFWTWSSVSSSSMGLSMPARSPTQFESSGVGVLVRERLLALFETFSLPELLAGKLYPVAVPSLYGNEIHSCVKNYLKT